MYQQIYRKGLLLCGVVASCFIINQAQAQSCTTAPSCESLGYTGKASDCSISLKCPFDTSKVFCVDSAEFKASIMKAVQPDWSKITSIFYGGSNQYVSTSYTATANGILVHSNIGSVYVTAINGKTIVNQKLDPQSGLIVAKGDVIALSVQLANVYFVPFKGF